MFLQWLKDKLTRGEEPTYIVRHDVTKPQQRGVNSPRARRRGIGWTRKDKSKDKAKTKRKRLITQASRRTNRRK